jgi:hypothetical protein
VNGRERLRPRDPRAMEQAWTSVAGTTARRLDVASRPLAGRPGAEGS